ncbi:carboxypeptidase regulatory-like domain-containing protein [Candidatus Palauibacter sp.]|uniref:carboxypeptidase regulatory-like domain-containing protein n=1 Tax=Candidatus Palauibacter sp. TaxID=3101350 RepID=UPI003B026F3D
MTGTRKRHRRGLQATLVRATLLAVALAATLGTAPGETAAQEAVDVAGTIVDDATGEPIEGATVRLADASGSARETITGPDGAFAFAQVALGAHTLGVQRLGYEVLSTPLEIGQQALSRLDVRLQPRAIPLAPLEVDVEGRPPRLVESGFYDRREEGWGTFLDPEWVEANKVGFIRLNDFMSALQFRAPLSGCPQVQVWLDRRLIGRTAGRRTSRPVSTNFGASRLPGPPPATLLEELSAYDVGAVEVYQPGTKIPLFAWNDATRDCGVIIAWSNWMTATAEIPQLEVKLCQPAGRPGEVTLEGFVEDPVTKVRLPAAHVVVSYATSGDLDPVARVARTDSLGRYRLCDLAAGTEVELAAAYGPHRGDASIVEATGVTDVRLGVPVTSPGSITGVITNAVTGRPLEAVRIILDDKDFRAVTDRTGAFSLRDLPPSSYRIRALCGGFDSSVQTVNVTAGQQVRVVISLRSKGTPRRTRCSA